jgi:hypothetical protein
MEMIPEWSENVGESGWVFGVIVFRVLARYGKHNT